MPDDRPVNRRRFFREGFRELLKPLAKAVVPLERAAQQLRHLEDPAPPAPDKRPPHTPITLTAAPNTVPRGPKAQK